MTRDETIELLMLLKNEYKDFIIPVDKDERRVKINTWYAILGGYDYKVIQKAVYHMLSTLKFTPKIANIKEAVCKILYPDDITEQEAVNLIMKALDNAYYKPRTAFNSLPPLLRRIVGEPQQLKQWATMDNNTLQSVIASNISRSYRDMVQQKKEQQITGTYIEDQLPDPVEVKRIGHIDYEIPERESVTDLITHAVNIAKKANEERDI